MLHGRLLYKWIWIVVSKQNRKIIFERDVSFDEKHFCFEGSRTEDWLNNDQDKINLEEQSLENPVEETIVEKTEKSSGSEGKGKISDLREESTD